MAELICDWRGRKEKVTRIRNVKSWNRGQQTWLSCQMQPATCLCMAWELRWFCMAPENMVFIFFKWFLKSEKKKNSSWHMKIICNSNLISTKHSRVHSFAHVYSYFHIIQSGAAVTDRMAHKTKYIYYLDLYRTSLLSPVLDNNVSTQLLE